MQQKLQFLEEVKRVLSADVVDMMHIEIEQEPDTWALQWPEKVDIEQRREDMVLLRGAYEGHIEICSTIGEALRYTAVESVMCILQRSQDQRLKDMGNEVFLSGSFADTILEQIIDSASGLEGMEAIRCYATAMQGSVMKVEGERMLRVMIHRKHLQVASRKIAEIYWPILEVFENPIIIPSSTADDANACITAYASIYTAVLGKALLP